MCCLALDVVPANALCSSECSEHVPSCAMSIALAVVAACIAAKDW